MEYFKLAFKKFAEFHGRSTKSEYWYFFLFNFLIGVGFSVLAGVTGMSLFAGLSGIYSLVALIPGISVAVRRLHDIGKSGWMLLVAFIPIAGLIWLIVLLVTDSNPEENQYGPNPNHSVAGDFV